MDLSCIFEWLTSQAWQLLNSNFTAALAGALAGVYGADSIARRTANRRDIVTEVRCANAAIMVSLGITNTFCGLKQQHVQIMAATFQTQKQALLLHAQERKAGRQNGTFHFDADFENLPEPVVPIDLLSNLVFEKLSIQRRPLALTMVLAQSVKALGSCIGARNALIQDFRARFPNDPDALARAYFGLPTVAGHLDRRYSDTLAGIIALTDDCIFFSHMLGLDIQQHAAHIAPAIKRAPPKVEATDFDKAKQAGLIPDQSNYLDWVNMPTADASWHE
ncbi:hypothetical protein [Dongia sp.]|jgi:hypothetical protein|uniref:hypothetical protein n=1 Tax=Dongia sp. TaxID=1977262 RepID=UPI0035B2B8E0